MRALFALFLVAGCARGLAPGEEDFAKALFGDSLNTDRIIVQAGIGVVPLPRDKTPNVDADAPPPRKPPKGMCKRVPSPRLGWQYPAGFVLWNEVYLKSDFYRSDMMEGWPNSVLLPHALLMAHELVHVWQWQNRARTDYTPSTSGAESVGNRDPYFYEADPTRTFLSYGFEQQAAMIEDYVCYRLFEPNAPRRRELYELINPVLPLGNFEAALAR
ncbi:hypothetical protein [Aliiroseovarius subalbicans]|uniref:hypothetical protein n=1 Tax=Aliiroseovarius subalbicans TaxID=2925840 RepID=UPI001F575A0C|nr:hypothetical protein [Aliiroseovarius subalbicans]MCI2399374.1 hypothetical protein [Aliiroseovarius subalbicans]